MIDPSRSEAHYIPLHNFSLPAHARLCEVYKKEKSHKLFIPF